jgi:predicted phosphoribosyltransferase
VHGRTALLVDDGLATGSTLLAAMHALRAHKPLRIVVAVPTAAAETCEDLLSRADEVICAATPEPFRVVGSWYEDLSQTSDEEVRELLASLRHDPVHETDGQS